MTFLSANNSNLFSKQGQGLCFSQFYICEYMVRQGFPGSSDSKESACNAEDVGSITGLGRSLEEGMATHSSICAWRIPVDKGGAWQASMESQRVTHMVLPTCTSVDSDSLEQKILKKRGKVEED